MKVRSLSKAFLREMALDFGGVPPFDPEKRQKIERGEHPYADNPAFPREPGAGSYPPGEHPGPGRVRSYADLIASEQYRKLAHKIAQVLGIPPQRVGPNNAMPIMMEFMQAWTHGMQYEEEHREQLQDLAIDTVLNFREFTGLRAAYEEDEFRIRAELVQQVGVGDMDVEPPPPDEQKQAELDVAEIAQEMDIEQNKRRFINMLIQGAAINRNHAYEEVRAALDHIDPRLFNLYAVMMSVAEWLYWVMPDDRLKGAMGAGEGAAGKARFYIDEDGVPVVHAQALVFPVLIQELVKGIMEYLSWVAQQEEGTDPDTAQHVASQTDTMGNEIWDIMFGPGVWRQIMRMVGEDNADLMRYIYTDIAAKPAGEFNRLQQQILRGEPEARQYLQNLVTELRREQEGGEEPPAAGPEPETPPPAPGVGSGGEEPDAADWWKNEAQLRRDVWRMTR